MEHLINLYQFICDRLEDFFNTEPPLINKYHLTLCRGSDFNESGVLVEYVVAYIVETETDERVAEFLFDTKRYKHPQALVFFESACQGELDQYNL